MTQVQHIIKQVQIELQMPPDKKVQKLQDEVSAFARGELPAIIESIFDDINTSKHIHVIDKIEIDLGNIELAHFKTDFISKFKMLFAKEFVSKHREEIHNQEVLKAKSSVSNSSELLRYYLQFGTLPWYRENETVDLNAELQQVLKSNDVEFIQFLETKLHESGIRDRLVYSFSEKSIRFICAAFWGAKMPQLDQFIKQFPLIIPSLISNIKHASHSRIHEELKRILLHISSIHKSSASSPKELFVSTIANTFFSTPEKFAKELQRVIKMASSSRQKTRQNMPLLRTDVLETLNEWSHILKHLQSSSNNSLTVEHQTNETPPIKAFSSMQSQALNQQQTTDFYISNGGMVLLHPFLPQLFKIHNLLKEGVFINKTAQHKAMHLLQFAVFGNRSSQEYQMILNKILCAYPLNEPIPIGLQLSRHEKQEVTNMIHAVLNHWSALKNTSVEGFQKSFLQRNAVLRQNEKSWELSFERMAFDLLLDRIPWNYNLIKLTWMQKHLTVKW